MRTLHNYIEASKKRREDGEAGFSLIELIVVVAILGILVAIAIPVFGTIQQSAKDSALHTVAANAATQSAAQSVAGGTFSLANLSEGGKISFSGTGSAAVDSADIGTICIQATAATGSSMFGAAPQSAGPGCP